MAGTRQHYLPRLLLRGFASRTSGDEVYSWVCRKESQPFESNIINIGVSNRFYGPPGDGSVDENMTETESRFGASIGQLRRMNHSAEINDTALPGFVAQLSVRTKHVRESLLECSDYIIQELIGFMADDSNILPLVRTWLRNNADFFEEQFTKVVDVRLPRSQRRQLFKVFKTAALRALESNTNAAAKEFFPKIRTEIQQRLPAALAEGILQSLAQSIIPKSRSVEFRKLHWYVITPTPVSMILGDLGLVMQVRTGDTFRTFPDEPDDVEVVYLPISDRQLLLGTRERKQPNLDYKKLNSAIASCSREFIVGSSKALVEEHSSDIGKTSSLLSPSELETLLAKLSSELLDGD